MSSSYGRARSVRSEQTYSNKRKAEEPVEALESGKSDTDGRKRIKSNDRTSQPNNTPADFRPQALVSMIDKSTRRCEPDLTLIELEAKRIPGRAFIDTSDWSSPRDLNDLPKFLEQYNIISKFASTQPRHPIDKGCPRVIVLTSAGIRAADITRTLRVFQSKDATVAKLFAKHIKLVKAIEYVKRTKISIGVGTPSRVTDLFKSGALSFGRLAAIVVDFSYRDEKRRNILDIKETQCALIELLNLPELRNRYTLEIEPVEIALF